MKFCFSQYLNWYRVFILIIMALFCSCSRNNNPPNITLEKVTPVLITQPVMYDSDDPAIWIDKSDPSKSIIIGTDKDSIGALYVYDLDGKIIENKVVRGLKRPNNVDVEYGLLLNNTPVDIAVTTERFENRLRIFSLPDMKPIDNGGIPVFEGETQRDPMGISLYRRPADGTIFAIVGRKDGPTNGTYLWQYRLEDDGSGHVRAIKVREFGLYSGKKEIESIAVDDKLGYIYYSDEQVGVRKYLADPDAPEANKELALFATTGFAGDNEGISVYELDDRAGYILVSDQQANEFHIFTREGEAGNPHQHNLLKIISVSTNESDGSEVTNLPLNDKFPQGLFVAMSVNKTFHYYSWIDIAGKDLKSANK
jgi:3-phytase